MSNLLLNMLGATPQRDRASHHMVTFDKTVSGGAGCTRCNTLACLLQGIR